MTWTFSTKVQNPNQLKTLLGTDIGLYVSITHPREMLVRISIERTTFTFITHGAHHPQQCYNLLFLLPLSIPHLVNHNAIIQVPSLSSHHLITLSPHHLVTSPPHHLGTSSPHLLITLAPSYLTSPSRHLILILASSSSSSCHRFVLIFILSIPVLGHCTHSSPVLVISRSLS